MKVRSIEADTIDCLRLPLSIAVVFFHAYTTSQHIGWLGDKSWYSGISYLFSLELGEIGVPAFFMISGYLFFRTKEFTLSEYKRKMNGRLRTLLVPYLFWNLLFIVLFFVAEQIPAISQYFSGANKRISDYSWIDFLRAFWDNGDWKNGNSVPIDWPLWFVRNLFCLCLVSPIIKYFITYLRIWGVAALFLVWCSAHSLAFWPASCFFFSLGAYFSLCRRELLPVDKQIRFAVIGGYILLVAIDYFIRGMEIQFYVHRFTVLCGVFFSIFLTAYCVEHCRIQKKTYWGAMAFFIFALHGPLINIVRKVTIKLLPDVSDFMCVVLYFANVFLIVGFIVCLFLLLKRFLPRFLYFITGR